MTIDQLLKMPVGEKVGGFSLSIKTYKKTWPVGKVWFQQVILADATGEIPADVNLGKTTIPNTQPGLRGHGNTLKIIVCEVQNAEYLGKDRKKLLVDQFSSPTMTMTEYEAIQGNGLLEWEREIKGKIRHGIVCSMIQKLDDNMPINLRLTPEQKKEIEALVEFIMTGE